VASLLDSLRRADANEQAAALPARDPAAHVSLDDSDRVAYLLGSLRQAGAHEQAAVLAGRLPAVGMFGLFLRLKASRMSSVSAGRPMEPRPGRDDPGAGLSGMPRGDRLARLRCPRIPRPPQPRQTVSVDRLGELSAVDRRN
jgi:hypothetical protein